METCSKGRIFRTFTGTITVFGQTINVNESVPEEWDNCKCKDDEVYVEDKCITASLDEKGKVAKGKQTVSLGLGVTIDIEYDLKIDSTGEITNCEYHCRKKSAKLY